MFISKYNNFDYIFRTQITSINLKYLTWRCLQAGGQSVRLYPRRTFETSSQSPCGQEVKLWLLQQGTAHTAQTAQACRATKLDKEVEEIKTFWINNT